MGVPVAPLRPACPAKERWDGAACVPWGDVAARLDEGAQAVKDYRPDEALVALDAVAAGGPLDHVSNVRLWEQRGIAHGYLQHKTDAVRSFSMLLDLDPSHLLRYDLSPHATHVFEEARVAARARGAPALEVDWDHGLRAGAPVPVEVDVIADPAGFLARASLFVRRRGERAWRAADLTLPPPGKYQRLILPAIDVRADTALEVYLRAYDRAGNEVLTWASPERPREIALAWDPPTRWYRRWWVWAIAGSVVAGVTGGAVYATTREPPPRVEGSVVTR